ncbi:fimbria/pilus outer membrane usher protein [Pragia fontium]|uniref:PapC C-terminal domain-containing protein n=1 Tax=Pragia fontium DSM 5563 = ATCC 49100 TaxID=1122977 RepID=A0AAJ4W7X1_9GAMM|nr:fimbria/pilus outer membrane usher protein [Pragia fontium]SFC06007.1 PapC C-terminal domain-containing protein [Pragia fontium DSM 5563 = ATCC 49100]VEJ53909.1 Outer membrane usher protein papC precursor [Pragia fontium]
MKIQPRFIKNRITLSILLVLMTGSAQAVQFNLNMLDAEDKANIDFSNFSQTGYVMPGEYQLQIKLNGESLGNEMTIPFYPFQSTTDAVSASDPLPQACLAPKMAEKLGLTEDALKKLTTWHDNQCIDFSTLPGVTLVPDLGAGALDVNLPQAWLEYSDATWLPPSRWDHGIAGGLLDYNLNTSFSRSEDGRRQRDISFNGTAGLNAGAWRLRADYQGSDSQVSGRQNTSQRNFDLTRAYLYRPLPSLQSTLTLGEDYVNSSLFDSWRYTGMKLASDERMLPPRLREYAPEIIGVANTNARVTVTQQGRKVYDSTVPAGPFRIQSLDSAIRGTLDVTITEQNGEERKFSVSTASVPYLTRPGQVRYQLIGGRPSTWDHDLQGQTFVAGEISWGVSNAWSVYGGGTVSQDYQAAALGVGRDLFLLGTIALDVTQTTARFPDKEDQKGKSWRLSYSKFFDKLDTDVTFAGYRFSEKEFLSMQEYLDKRYQGGDRGQQKERYQVNVNKRFDAFSLSLNYEKQTYWDQGETEQFGGSVGTYFNLPSLDLRNLSVNGTVTRSQYQGRKDDMVSVMVSVPLGSGTVSYNGSRRSGRYSQLVGYYGLVGKDSYSMNAGIDSGGGESSDGQFNGMYTHNGDLSKVSANVAVAGRSSSSVGLSASGGLTVTGQGAALHPAGYNGGTRLMLSTDGVAGVPLDGRGVKSNAWGIGVLGDVNSYYRTTARIDLDTLPDNVEATQGVVEASLTEGAIGYRKFSVLQGAKVFAVLRLVDSSYPPFGASVRDSRGREVGLVGEQGLAWLSGISPESTLKVEWAGKVQCQVSLPAQIGESNLLLPCQALESN